MFYEKYKAKTDSELHEIFESSVYAQEARSTAKRILHERGFKDLKSPKEQKFETMNLFQLLKETENYGYKIKESYEGYLIQPSFNAFSTGILFLILGSIPVLYILLKGVILGHSTSGGGYIFGVGLLFILTGIGRIRYDDKRIIQVHPTERKLKVKEFSGLKSSERILSPIQLDNFSFEFKDGSFMVKYQDSKEEIVLLSLPENQLEETDELAKYITLRIKEKANDR